MRVLQNREQRGAYCRWLQGELQRAGYYDRQKRRYLRTEFAAQHGFDPVTVWRWLRGEQSRIPTAERCRDLGEALGVPFLEVEAHAGYHTLDDLDAYVAFRNRISLDNGQLMEVA